MILAMTDGQLPPPDGVRDRLLSIVKHEALLEGLIYTFPGGSLNGLENHETVQLGYVAGPGGRAVIFGDGRVEWVPEKP